MLTVINLYPDFYDKYPFLVKKICKRDDLTILYKIRRRLQSVNSMNLL